MAQYLQQRGCYGNGAFLKDRLCIYVELRMSSALHLPKCNQTFRSYFVYIIIAFTAIISVLLEVIIFLLHGSNYCCKIFM